MKRWLGVASLLTMLAVLPAAAQDDNVPEIKEVMRKLHKGAESLRAHVGKALKSGSPNWGEIQTDTKVYATLAEALGKNQPPKGDAASWKKLTTEYAKNAKALDDAAKQKDRESAQAAYNKLANCTGCHKAHKG